MMILTTNDQEKYNGQLQQGESRMSNAFVSLKSQPASQQEVAKGAAPAKDQTMKHDFK